MSESELARQIAAEVSAAYTEPAIRFTLDQGGEPGIFESKVGGTPYLPRELAWPLDGSGFQMSLLAQIDCAALAGLPDFPHTGLLQFFIGLDDVYGAGFDDPSAQKGFRVLYHEAVDRSVTADEVLSKQAAAPMPEDDDELTPLGGAYGIRFAPVSVQHITNPDYRAWTAFLQRWNQLRGTDFKTQWDYYQATKLDAGFPDHEESGPLHQLGGYPAFIQRDFRQGAYEDMDVLLFQLDSDMQNREDLVLWGDCGTAAFFISREALKRRDFSRVCYSWDCS